MHSIGNLQDPNSLLINLKSFNHQAEEEIRKLTKEIEADKYSYDI